MFDLFCPIGKSAKIFYSERHYCISKFMSRTYEQRIQAIKESDLGLAEYQAMVTYWLINRPPMLYSNRDVSFIAELTAAEVDEALAEVEKQGTDDYDNQMAAMEVGDAGWLAIGLAGIHQLEIDYPKVRSRVNGYGGRSDIFDLLKESAGNIQEKTLQKDLEHFLSIWMSAFAGLPEYTKPDDIVAMIYRKNDGNYVADAFVGRLEEVSRGVLKVINPFTGQVMSDEELNLAYQIPRRALRMIRDFQISVLGRSDREKGLKYEDYAPYLPDVLTFLQFVDFDQARVESEKSLEDLYLRLHMDHGLPVGTLKKR